MAPLEAVQSTAFLEGVYATLTAWGMLRMGPRGAKMGAFAEMEASFWEQMDQIAKVADLSIWDVERQDVPDLSKTLWEIIAHLRVGVGKTKIVAGSKALHHLLPDLVPPIDRQYTLRFFYNHKMINQREQVYLQEMYPRFCPIAAFCQEDIRSRLGTGMNTSITKVIDNAIVGYGLEYLVERRST
jgi:hypothetical protein